VGSSIKEAIYDLIGFLFTPADVLFRALFGMKPVNLGLLAVALVLIVGYVIYRLVGHRLTAPQDRIGQSPSLLKHGI